MPNQPYLDYLAGEIAIAMRAKGIQVTAPMVRDMAQAVGLVDLSQHWLRGKIPSPPRRAESDTDPSFWCVACRARRREDCKCPPIADND